ncbi:hypothetical protein GCM10025734_07180 [Kitasatospora paranensis]|uniref:LppX_LprAFG lipoprotein n=1 Tax=Kitasatospora paranensis TaxID=258053 RepID=UPI0031EAB773
MSRQLAFLTRVTDVTRLGQETVDGAATVHYRGRLDLGTAGAQLLGASLPSGVPVDVWVDDRHRIRQEKVRLDVTATESTRGDGSATASPTAAAEVVLRLTDFGTPVVVTAPPAGATTDLGAPAAPARVGGPGVGRAGA